MPTYDSLRIAEADVTFAVLAEDFLGNRLKIPISFLENGSQLVKTFKEKDELPRTLLLDVNMP
jgi:hypothetical protein